MSIDNEEVLNLIVKGALSGLVIAIFLLVYRYQKTQSKEGQKNARWRYFIIIAAITLLLCGAAAIWLIPTMLIPMQTPKIAPADIAETATSSVFENESLPSPSKELPTATRLTISADDAPKTPTTPAEPESSVIQDSEWKKLVDLEEGYEISLPADWIIAQRQKGEWQVVNLNPAFVEKEQEDLILSMVQQPFFAQYNPSLVGVEVASDDGEMLSLLEIHTIDNQPKPNLSTEQLQESFGKHYEEMGISIAELNIIERDNYTTVEMLGHVGDQTLIQFLVIADEVEFWVQVVPTDSSFVDSKQALYHEIFSSFHLIERAQ